MSKLAFTMKKLGVLILEAPVIRSSSIVKNLSSDIVTDSAAL